ncbi:Zn-ribbon domain-containing OB-fold protein [Parafrankia sp. EUN1f]|uniref:Zn-ribbon domain-containing OB-fold protein n=1 Tax=Parafrankia sp. EUN1f TaxID=102897 RepID=UPI0001C4784D|nr:zinc ribbon domain-containing protein [Parafrankia sp. EUN1f]EFC79274.1 protein of unknown function DUF35 [Parafrankia sp. EUN1f]
MGADIAPGVPADLPPVVERHGQVVAAGDQRATLADFRPDRIGQLVASAALPDRMSGSEVLSIAPGDGGLMTAHIRYSGVDGERIVLRSRWIRLPQGWRVSDVRNVPDTPPVLAPVELGGPDEPYWAAAREGELRIQRCGGCGEWIWAPRPICPACHGFDLEWPVVAPEGRIFSWTRTWQPFAPEVRGHLPYVVVLVELPAAGGRRVLGVLRDADGADLRIGLPVRGEFDPPASPAAVPLLRWRIS